MSELENVAFLFTDIEGSTRLWEQQPDAMRPALEGHDALTHEAVLRHHGSVVKKTGDGVHAAFASPLDAVRAMLDIQLALADAGGDGRLALRVRCGVHVGLCERRAGDYDGVAVNRAARVAGAAHGGQMLVTQAVVDALAGAAALPEGTALRALGTVRLRDLAHAETLWQLVHPRLRVDFPALRSLDATPNNLPQQLDSFVNRHDELLAARRLLQGHRLVTLFGAGGIGKSRLSVQLAAELLDDFPDGVWCVELAPLADGQRIAQAIATVLGVKEEAGRPVSEALARYVPDRRLLILLDNCEHLAAACATLAKQLLQAGPQLKLLATSREALHVAGEAVLDVPALSVPDAHDEAAITPDALARHEAVRLFVDRAAAAQPAFRIGEHNARAVAEICRGLDGLPLAIELAAARTRSMSVEAIAARLGDRLRLLSTQDRTVLPRQQTLRALIDWSHDLLSEPERALFRRMAVFAGGWSLEAAEAVGAGDGVEAGDVVDLLGRLVEKSLVVMQAGGGRYRMLDTVAGYARERLRQAGDDEAATCQRHLDFYVALAEAAAPELFGPDQGRWLARLDIEQDNLLAAQSWCARGAGGAESALRLVFALRAYWINRGLLALGHRATVETLALHGAQARTAHRCSALHAAGQLSFITGRYAEARRELEEGLALAVELGDEERRAAVLYLLALACINDGDLVRAQAPAREAVTLARQRGDKRQLATAVTTLAHVHRMQGQHATAEPFYSQALTLAQQVGDRQSIALALLNLAMAVIGRGATDAARSMLVEAIVISAEIGSSAAGQSALEVAAGLAARERHWARAGRLFGAAEAQAQRSGSRRDAVDDAFLAPLITEARQALDVASWAAAESAGRALNLSEALADADAWLRSSDVAAC